MFKKLICVALIVIAAAFAAYSQSKKPVNRENLITALTKSKKINAVFGDAGVLLFTYEPEIQRIVRLRRRALPLLIAHLDDKRPMPYLSFNVSRAEETVTVGDFCLDFLLRIIVHKTPIFDLKCEDESPMDSPGDCLNEGYYGGHLKQNWLKAYRKGLVRYEPQNNLRDDD